MNFSCRIGLMGMIVAGLMVCAAPALGAGVTIYVDAANTEGPWDGSEANPWQAIRDAVDHLAAVNAASPGGHTILVAAGTYKERVDLPVGVSGEDGNRNTLLAEGTVTIDNAYPIVAPASYIIIDGFTLIGNVLSALSTSGDDGLRDSIVRNCVFSSAGTGETRKSGIGLRDGGDGMLISNCVFRTQGCGILVSRGRSQKFTVADSVFYNLQNWAIAFYSSAGTQAIVTNSIFAGTGSYAFYRRSEDGSRIEAYNNLIWGSGSANVANESAGQFYSTESEINALNTAALLFSNNIVANPGFANLWDDWDFNSFYANSPCLKENNGFARHIGPYQDPDIRPVYHNTYYVQEGGDDGADGLSLENAWATLGQAAGVAGAGDTVRVQQGNYQESVLITAGGSGNAPVTYVADGDVTVDGGGAAYGIRVYRAAGVVLDGFKITGATAGVSLVHAPGCELRNGVFYQNIRGVLMTYSPACLLEGLQVFDNTSEGILSANNGPSGSTLSRSAVFSNTTGVYVGMHSTGWIIKNCNIYSNSDTGIRQYYPMYSLYNKTFGGIPTRILHCNIIDNANYGFYAMYDTPTVKNSIILGNDVGVFEHFEGDNTHLLNNCFYVNGTNFYHQGTTARDTPAEINEVAVCENNIVADPLFKISEPGKYALSGESPCIHAGADDAGVYVDFYGQRRPVGPGFDIGSYEMPPRGTLLIIR